MSNGITHFDAFLSFSTKSISFVASSNCFSVMDGKFSSISRRKFYETAIGAATDSEESLVRRAPLPSCYYFHIDLKRENISVKILYIF